MGFAIGLAVGGLVFTYLFSRLFLWLTRRLGDTRQRILTAYALAYGSITLLGSLGFADGGPPRYGFAAAVYFLPTLLWMALDLTALKRRAGAS